MGNISVKKIIKIKKKRKERKIFRSLVMKREEPQNGEINFGDFGWNFKD